MRRYRIAIKRNLPELYKLIILINHLFERIVNLESRKNNSFSYLGTYFKRYKIRVHGKQNEINIINSDMTSSKIYINGSNNKVEINDGCLISGLEIWIEDDNNELIIGSNTIVNGNTHLACIEGKKICIGNDCLFSSNIVFRVGDSHSILYDGKRFNKSKDIRVGDHVWIGNSVTILKGVSIGNDSIIGTGSIVTKDVLPNCIVAGNPAKVIKDNTSWDIKRIPVNE